MLRIVELSLGVSYLYEWNETSTLTHAMIKGPLSGCSFGINVPSHDSGAVYRAYGVWDVD